MKNTPSPLIPQGSIPPSSRGASNLRIAVVTVVAIHIVFFGGLLLQGCKRDTGAKKGETSSTSTNASSLTLGPGPMSDTNSLYYSSPTNLPDNALISTNVAGSASTTRGNNGVGATMAGSTNPGAAASAAPAGDEREYTIARGDTFGKIAKDNKVTVAALKASNPTVDPAKLHVGAKIKIPAPVVKDTAAPGSTTANAVGDGSTYVVKGGDNLTKIAHQFGVSVSEIRAANNLKVSRVNAGQKLKIPAKSSKPAADVTAGNGSTAAH